MNGLFTAIVVGLLLCATLCACEVGPGYYHEAGAYRMTVRVGDTCQPFDDYNVLVDGDYFVPYPDTLGSLSFAISGGRHEITVRRHIPTDPTMPWTWTTVIHVMSDTVIVVPCHDI